MNHACWDSRLGSASPTLTPASAVGLALAKGTSASVTEAEKLDKPLYARACLLGTLRPLRHEEIQDERPQLS